MPGSKLASCHDVDDTVSKMAVLIILMRRVIDPGEEVNVATTVVLTAKRAKIQ